MMPDISFLLSATEKPDAAPAAPGLTREQAELQAETQAKLVEEAFAAAILAVIDGKTLGGLVQTSGYKFVRDRMLAACGSPTDPLEIMLLEQLLWAHHQLGVLHTRAATTASPEQAVTLNMAAVKLMAEHRKTTLALREYRSPITPKQVTVVRQQNVSAGDQQIALVESCPVPTSTEKNHTDSEQGSRAIAYVEPETIIPQSETRGRRKAEPVTSPRSDRRRSAAVEA